MNYRYALILTREPSFPAMRTLLQHWLTTGAPTRRGIDLQMEPVVGQRRFWKIVEEAPVSEDMRSFQLLQRHIAARKSATSDSAHWKMTSGHLFNM